MKMITLTNTKNGELIAVNPLHIITLERGMANNANGTCMTVSGVEDYCIWEVTERIEDILTQIEKAK
jgi:hypothetical protein